MEVFQVGDNVVARRLAHDALWRVGSGTAFLVELRNAPHDTAYGRARFSLHDDPVPGARLFAFFGPEEGLQSSYGVQLDGDERPIVRHAHNCSTTQSATILTAAFFSSAASALPTAAYALTPRAPW